MSSVSCNLTRFADSFSSSVNYTVFSTCMIRLSADKVCSVTQLCSTLCNPWIIACQAPLSMGFPRQEYWSKLPCLSPRDLPDAMIELESPALQVDSLPSEPHGNLIMKGLVFIRQRDSYKSVKGEKTAGCKEVKGLRNKAGPTCSFLHHSSAH